MYAIQHHANLHRHGARPVSTRAAFGIWAAASVGGWLIVAAVLRVIGVL